MNPADPEGAGPVGRAAGSAGSHASTLAGLVGGCTAFVVLGVVGTIGAFGSPGALGATGARGFDAATPPAGALAFHGLGATFPDGAPARVAGGFGGDTCLACHWEFEDEVDAAGSLSLSGLPEAWTPGTSYPLEIELTHAAMAVGGFQLAARFASDTSQAGTFRIPEHESERITVLDEGGLRFAQHTEAGIPVPDGTGRTRWSVIWVAPAGPASGSGEVVLNVSAVAGNADRSQMGDHVYSAEFRVSR